jgi:hypothetical protein
MQPSDGSDARGDGVTLRLLWPQWQGAGTASVQEHAPEFPFEVARRGYAVGSAVLAAVLPANQGPTAAAPVAMDDTGSCGSTPTLTSAPPPASTRGSTPWPWRR